MEMHSGITFAEASQLKENFKVLIGGKFGTDDKREFFVYDIAIIPLSSGYPEPGKLKYKTTSPEKYQQWLNSVKSGRFTIEFVTGENGNGFINFFEPGVLSPADLNKAQL